MQVDYSFENKLRFASEHGANATTETAFGYKPMPVNSTKQTAKYVKPEAQSVTNDTLSKQTNEIQSVKRIIAEAEIVYKSDFDRWLNASDGYGNTIYRDLRFMTDCETPEEKDCNFYYEKYKEHLEFKLQEQKNFNRWKAEMQAEAELQGLQIWEYVELTKQRYK